MFYYLLFTDQSVVLELRNENLQLKNQIERLKYEREYPILLTK